jgi:pimeloyl-ACP methyl ester carboxylesterase
MIHDEFEVEPGSLHDRRPGNFFEFAYDWRRDNRASALALERLISDRLPLWREASGAADAKVIILAHSMGGIVARYYLERLGGAQDCRAFVTLGTPYRGSPQALEYLANGYRGYGLDLTELMRTFTSTYQLLPAYEMLSVNGKCTYVHDAEETPNVCARRAREAYQFLADLGEVCETRSYKCPYHFFPVVGSGQGTLQSAVLSDGRLTVERSVPAGVDAQLGDGDGTVPRCSAIPPEYSDDFRGYFVAERHSSLQNHEQILYDVRERLRQLQVRGLKNLRGAEAAIPKGRRAELSLDLEDAYLPGQPIELRARILGVGREFDGLRGTIEEVGETRRAMEVEWMASEGGWVASPALPPGRFRLTVSTRSSEPGSPPAIHDLFEVAASREA